MTTYVYGGFVLHDGVSYFLREKAFDLPPFAQTTFVVGRLEGVKKTGERQNGMQRDVAITVVGVSRSDLESKLDALLAALSVRQQSLVIHAEDTRYYVADAVNATTTLASGRVTRADVAVSFLCHEPYAYAPSPSGFVSGALIMAHVSGATWQLPSGPLSIASGGGNYPAYPIIVITNETTPNATTLTSSLVSGTFYTSLSVAALPHAATAGQTFLLSDGAGNTQDVVLSANASLGATTLSVTSFQANANYNAGAFCGLDVYLTGLTLTQTTDGETLVVSGLAAQLVGANGALVINGDPTTTSGYSVSASSARAVAQSYSGAFPTIDPGATSLTLSVTCQNQPTLNVQVVWTPRWLA